MKRQIITLALLACIASGAWAQAPAKFNYQGIARSATGAPMASQALGMRLSVLDGSAAGTAVYVETQSATTNAYGLYNIQVGGGTAVTGTMASVNWGSGDKYLKVEIDPAGGSNYTAIGTSQLLSVPYALSSGTSGTANAIPKYNSSGAALVSSQIQEDNNNIGIGNASNGAKLFVDGSAAGLNSATIEAHNNDGAGIALYAHCNSSDVAAVIGNNGNGGFLKCFNGGASHVIGMRVGSPGNAGGGRIDIYATGTGANTGGYLAAHSQYGLVMGDQTTGGTGIMSAGGTTYPNAVLPWTNNTSVLGNAAYKWTAVWATNGTVQTSDERTKQNIKAVSYGLNTIMQLKPVSWNWKDKNAQIGTGTNLGFIAQDVEKILPDVIVHTYATDAEIAAAKKDKGIDIDKDSYGVKYAEFTPVIVKAMQEQQQQIEALSAQVKALTEQLSGLEKKQTISGKIK